MIRSDSPSIHSSFHPLLNISSTPQHSIHSSSFHPSTHHSIHSSSFIPLIIPSSHHSIHSSSLQRKWCVVSATPCTTRCTTNRRTNGSTDRPQRGRCNAPSVTRCCSYIVSVPLLLCLYIVIDLINIFIL